MGLVDRLKKFYSNESSNIKTLFIPQGLSVNKKKCLIRRNGL